ncbi:MAG: RtcB family protein [Planctomycetota bacterium]|jgi:tRNA-splicing ligase RtcB
MTELRKISDHLFEVPKTGAMRVPGRIYASDELLRTQKHHEAVDQVRNVAHLPGIVRYSLAMPDFHWGYGFPIGGVAAFDVEKGVVSPGGIGYDINCGVRILRSNLTRAEVEPKLKELLKAIFHAVPAGVGSEGAIEKIGRNDLKTLLRKGSKWAVERGYGTEDDLERTEDGGVYEGADPDQAGDRALQRGMKQVGTLGSGNHFLEIQVVEEIFLPDIAAKLGVEKDQVVFSIHSGSRGFGYQICDDFIRTMMRASKKYGIPLPDRQLCSAPLDSDEAERYIGAMACAANYAWVNRQVMAAIIRRVAARAMDMSEKDLGAGLIYDVCHNIGKFEEHEGVGTVFVHRKGATRALAPGHPLLPPVYRGTGQPVFIPGDMGRPSFLLVGRAGAMEQTFGSTCHGAGRAHSRSAMLKRTQGRDLFREMREKHGVLVMARGKKCVAEEMPEAYKDASLVVDVMERAGVSAKVARLRPIGCVKG